jgi:hypothetical protein
LQRGKTVGDIADGRAGDKKDHGQEEEGAHTLTVRLW